MITVSNPQEVWLLFCTDFRNADPIVRTCPALDYAIDSIVDDIVSGSDIQAFYEPQIVAKLLAGASDGRGANKHFLSFLDDLQRYMAEEKVTKVRLTRAINLLYNYDFVTGDWAQAFLDHFHRPGNRMFVLSTQEFEERHGHRIELELPNFTTADSFIVDECLFDPEVHLHQSNT